MRWTEEQLKDYQQRNSVLADIGKSHGLPPKPSKHRNHKVEVDGRKFDSKREHDRYQQLRMMEKSGSITGLECQREFELVPAVILGGRRKPAVKYRADFVYYRGAVFVVEDTKSPHLRKDPYYRLKKHLMMHVHSIEITEI